MVFQIIVTNKDLNLFDGESFVNEYLFLSVATTTPVDLCAPENKETLAYLVLRSCPKPRDMAMNTLMEKCM